MSEQQTEGNVEAAEATVEPHSETEILRHDLASAQRLADENYEKYLRARADMENYKKRIERTYADLARSSKKELLLKLLQVKDNLERALGYGSSAEQSEGVMQGVRLTEYQLNQLLEQEGVKRIEAEGKPFDPAQEEALHTVHDPSQPDQSVVQVVRQGYMYGDGVLRPAQVIVNVHQEDE